MPDYEFHVQGLIGPVVQSALPELTRCDGPRLTRLYGTAAEPTDIDLLLRRLTDSGLVADHILLSTQSRWVGPGANDDDQRRDDQRRDDQRRDDQSRGATDSAPRQS